MSTRIAVVTLLGVLCAMSACQRTSIPAQDSSSLRIGVYDSRSVAVAFAGSPSSAVGASELGIFICFSLISVCNA